MVRAEAAPTLSPRALVSGGFGPPTFATPSSGASPTRMPSLRSRRDHRVADTNSAPAEAARGVGYNLPHIPQPTRRFDGRQCAARRAGHRRDHFTNGTTLPVAQVQRQGSSALGQVIQSGYVPLDQIRNVYVIADSRAVPRRIIAPENFEMGNSSKRGLAGAFDEVSGSRCRLPVRPLGSAPATLK